MGYTHGIQWTDELIKQKVLEVVGERKSKYYKFTDRFDLIEETSLFWENLTKNY